VRYDQQEMNRKERVEASGSAGGGRELLRHPIDWLMRVVFMAAHPRQHVLGVRVIVSDPTVPEADCVAKLETALVLLREADARRFGQVKRYVAHVIVWPGDHTAYDRWGGIHFESRYLLDAPPEIVAAGLVHEAVHLRIERYGIQYHPSLRARIEHRCVCEQAAFLRRLPGDGSRWAEEAEAALCTPWWTESMQEERVRRAARQAGLSDRAASILQWWSR
jgi:hypothetical protein